MDMKYFEVFVPGGYPQYTYNPRPTLDLEIQLAEAKENLCKLITVTGHTKSGKTVLARRVFPRNESVWIDGGAIACEEDIWTFIINSLDLYQDRRAEEVVSSSSASSSKGGGGANIAILKIETEVSTTDGRSSSSATSTGRRLTSRAAALSGLKESRVPLVIDDFHYLPPDLQGGIVRALKPLVFDGIPIIIIAIPHRRYDALKVEREMTGRIRPISVPSWTEDELCYIAETGFNLLKLDIPQNITSTLASEAMGSPHLMQEFCREVSKAETVQPLGVEREPLSTIFHATAETIGRPIFEKLARGPRQRSDRLPRALKNGRTVDIYELVLHGLAHLKPNLVTLEYEEIRAGIRDISDAQPPQAHEVTRVLKHMATIAATDQSSTPVIDYEDKDRRLHITDPFFAFYLRWGSLTT